MTIHIHTWAKVLHVFKEAKFLGNLWEKCSDYQYQYITRVFYCISVKMLLLRFIAHWEIYADPWQCGTDQKVSLPVAFGRNLALGTTRLFFHIYCQYATKKAPDHQQWCIVANYWTYWLKANGHCQPLWCWPKWYQQNFVRAPPNR